jgi:hypothetical protein|tara:strand:+ start:63 stop:323 length:261 start_codon:yes stop_codon:yes gene_type:complete
MKFNLLGVFTKHPSEVGESYWEHFKVAAGLALKLAGASIAQILHAIFPFFKPPFGLDVDTMSGYLQNKKPEMRKNCKDESDQKSVD